MFHFCYPDLLHDDDDDDDDDHDDDDDDEANISNRCLNHLTLTYIKALVKDDVPCLFPGR